MWLNTTATDVNTKTTTSEDEQLSICSEDVQLLDDTIDSNLTDTNHLSEEDETSEEESFTEDSSDEESFNSEEKEQQDIHEKLTDLVDDKIFEDTIANNTAPVRIIFGICLLLYRIRCLIIFIRKCHLINEYVCKQAKADKSIEGGELIIDFHVRWNTTCIMLTKFIEHRCIINEITNSPARIINLNKSKCNRLMSLTLRPQHWEWIICLKNVLDPFYNATNALSGRNYGTIAQGKVILYALKNFLSTQQVNHHLENILKRILLEKYKVYFEDKVTEEENRLTLVNLIKFYLIIFFFSLLQVAAFLCPYAKQYLSVAEFKAAETVLIQKYDEILRSKTHMSPATSNNIVTLSNNAEQSMKPSSKDCLEKSMDYLLGLCLVQKPPVPKAINSSMKWTIQQELGYYATTGNQKQKFESHWNLNQHKMPILSSLVRRFCLSPATSVASEAAFSYANYIQRKQRSALSPTNLCDTMVLLDNDIIKRLNRMY